MMKSKIFVIFSAVCYLLFPSTLYAENTTVGTHKPKVDIQEDPLGITTNRVANSGDLLRRISESEDKNKDLSTLTKKVLSEASHTSPSEFKGLSIQLYDQSVNSGTAIKELNNAKLYNNALSDAIKSVNTLVKSSEELQSSKDQFDIAVKGKDGFRNEFNKMKASIDLQNEQITALRNDNLVLRAKIQDIKSTEAEFKNNTSEGSTNSNSSSAINNSSSVNGGQNGQNNAVLSGPPFKVSLTFNSEDPNKGSSSTGNELKSSATIVLNNGNRLDVGVGYVSNGFKIVRITSDGVRVVPIVGGPAMLLPVQ